MSENVNLNQEDIMKNINKQDRLNVRGFTRIVYCVIIVLSRVFKLDKIAQQPKRIDGYFTPDDIQVEFGITKRVQSKYRNAGQLSYIKIGKVILYTKADIDEFFARCRVQTSENCKVKSKPDTKMPKEKDEVAKTQEHEQTEKGIVTQSETKNDSLKNTHQYKTTDENILNNKSREVIIQDNENLSNEFIKVEQQNMDKYISYSIKHTSDNGRAST